ncbi:MAG: hypothetical protein NUV91_02470 [Candidatus Omnitrophica bacterium]|nr:hypothetical protein [Candidatus Omnitrophota bacterium]
MDIKLILVVLAIGILVYFLLKKKGKGGCCGHNHDDKSGKH